MAAQHRPEANEPPLPAETGGTQEPQNVVDPARMRDLLTSLGDGLNDVIQTYLEDTPRLIEEIFAASRRGDREVVQRTAHSLKSSSGIFGAQALVAGCRSIEQRADQGQLPSEADVQALQNSFQKIKTVLNSYIVNP